MNECGQITIKPSTIDDFEDYYQIKCGDSDIYWMGFSSAPQRETLYSCFLTRLGDKPFHQIGDKRIYMIQRDRQSVGYIQFSLEEEGLRFGVSMDGRFQGKGYATAGMEEAIRIAKRYSDELFTYIRDDNIASQKLFLRLHFTRTDTVLMREYPRVGKIPYRKYIMFHAPEEVMAAAENR